MWMETKHTVCRLCSACCPVVVQLRKGKLICAERKRAVPLEEAWECPKLKAAQDIIYSPERLMEPLIKAGRGDRTEWKAVSWERALNFCSDRLEEIKRKYGAESICWMRGMAADWGAPWDYAVRFMHALGSPNVIGNGAVCHVARELAHCCTYGAMSSPDYKNSTCIVLWGKNERNTNPAGYESILYAKDRGTRLIVIDPIKTELASLADIWLQVKPGGDGLLAMSMIHVILQEELFDSHFVDEWTVGFQSLDQAVANYSPEKVAGRIWLDPEEIRESARLYANTKPACLTEGNGLDMHVNVSQNTRAVCILRALTGNIDRKGGDLLPQAVATRDIQLKDRVDKDIEPIGHKYSLFNRFHKTRGNHSLSSIVDAILEGKPYPIKALIIQASNPKVTMANSARFLRALEKLDFIVVMDLFQTQTCEHADLILPVTTPFEKTQLNLKAMSNPIVLQNQVIAWAGNSRPDWKIIFDLGKKMGYAEDFPWNTAEEAINYQLEPSGVTVDMLRDCPDGFFLEETAYEKYTKGGFNTPTGKVEFYSESYEKKGYPPIPAFAEDEENHLSYFEEREYYPFLGISGARPNSFVHSQFRNIPSLLKNEPEPVVDIHPEDAERKGIRDGDEVTIKTANGSIQMRARVSDIVHPRAIRVAWGWGELDLKHNLNRLTDDSNRDPISDTPSNRCFMCDVFKTMKGSRTK
jgi:anaerobic selenocysteine-containing dehydrogenase